MSLESWLAFTLLWVGLVALPGANAALVMASALRNGLPRAFAPLGITLTVPREESDHDRRSQQP